MNYDNEAELKERVEELTGRRIYGQACIIEDTSNYMNILSACVLRVGDKDYFIKADAKEGRFGIDDQPKFWVKHAVDLDDGSHKIIKLVFHEQFTTRLGFFQVRCRRSPDKESAVLSTVAGDPRFMQGTTVRDPAGNNIRVIDFIRGPTFFNQLADLDVPHEQYFHETLPRLMMKLIGCIEAMDFLHRRGLEHGDIRNDHIIVEEGTGLYRWIDFDYNVNYSDFDVWSMGNVLTYAAARGIVTCRAAAEKGAPVTPDDALLFYGYRLANLQQVYPYIPDALNDLLMRFSAGSTTFFSDFEELGVALRAAMGATWGGPGRRRGGSTDGGR
jgi:hypothetical protein